MDLVVIQNRQAVTSSLQVAETFEKRHDNVIRDIEGLLKNEEAQKYFYESSYEHSQNKQHYRMYYMNRDGFTLLAMGFTGEKAMEFKLHYIQAFNEMEKQISQPNSMEVMLQAALKHERELTEIRHDVDFLKDSMRIDGKQEHALKEQGKAKVFETLGGYGSPAYEKLSRKVFHRLWGDFKRHFLLPRSMDLPKSQFDEAVRFITIWRPETSMMLEIENYNRQGKLKLVQ